MEAVEWDETKNDAYRSAMLLFESTRSKDSSVRKDAALELAAYVDFPGVFERLVQLLDDEDTIVIESATKSLAHHGTVARIRGLVSVLAGPDGDGDVGYAIRDALVDVGQSDPSIRSSCEQIAQDASSREIEREARNLVKALPARPSREP